MFLSGYACYKDNVKWNVIGKRLNQLMLPFCSFAIISSLLSESPLYDYFLHPLNGLWFLWALFFITVIYVALVKFAEYIHTKEEYIVFPSAALLLLLSGAFKIQELAISTIMSFFFYYIFGLYFRKYNSIVEKSIKYLAIPHTMFFLILSFTYNRNSQPALLPIPHFMYIRAASLIAITALLMDFQKLLNRKIFVFSKLGGATLGIYAIHLLFFIRTDYMIVSIDNKYVYYVFILVATSILTSVSYFIMKVLENNKITGLIF
jgi:fucose 4-O-acetylase-like acetyltransferase